MEGNNYSYLIPANSKKSQLIASLFNGLDLGILIAGVGLSFLLMMVLPVKSFWIGVLSIFPGFISVFLVFPIPNYHNVRTVIRNAWVFYNTRQKYIWRGWCYKDGTGDKE